MIGRLAAINTLGAITGSLLTGFFILEYIGLWGSIRLLAVIYFLTAWFSLRTCSRSLRTAANCVRTERRNRSLHGVNEDFEHRPSTNGSGAVDLEQVLRDALPEVTPLKRKKTMLPCLSSVPVNATPCWESHSMLCLPWVTVNLTISGSHNPAPALRYT